MRDSQRARPRVEILESRTLLSQSTGAGAGKRLEILQSGALLSRARAPQLNFEIGSATGGAGAGKRWFLIPHGPPTSPRDGGAAALVGSGILLVVTNKPGANEATIQDDGAGNVTVEWNGQTPPTFHGVTQIVVDARGKANSVNFTLTGNVTAAQVVDVQLDGTNSDLIQNLGAFNTSGLLTLQTQTAPAPRNLAKGP